MHRHNLQRAPLIVAIVITSIALVPSCRRAPEEPVAAPVTKEGEAKIELIVLDLPQENREIGISLNATPPGLVATYNGERAIEITDEKRPSLRYTFDADLPESPSRSPKNIAEFESYMEKHTAGSLTDSGSIETVLGDASWASGTYSAEEQSFEDVRVFVPHPSGTGTLILFAVCPAGVATVEERLAMVREILAEVS